ncbi:amidase [Paenibacillus sp. TRM 82003]|uniref:amidase n=1 Tax=Kineococcus sp. TRM81007 TaxID=2925831 RepID=UPI001F56BC62|nr:amidase [Kineococcus sp. TRM81007]MCI2239408.1 amidase [Kineococcus sp. TRM81007]MCI3918778.1 amidase [Paenibacillus sp. TRM 82003]
MSAAADRALNRRTFLAAAAGTGAVAYSAATSVRSAAAAAPDVEVRSAAADDPTEATVAEALTLLRRGKLSATDLVQAHLDRIERFDGVYKAYNTVTAGSALAAAAEVDARRDVRRALSGIPLCIKDNYWTAGVPTTANSTVFADFVPDSDATAVARLTAAGGIVLGKGQMGPLATTRATTPAGEVTTVNAWTPDDPSVDPGGSSTGPATAVAARMAASSIGTQTGGSITNPSLQQNLTGLKPTMGRTSIAGIIPLTFTRDHSGPLARDAMDAAILTSVMAGPDPADPRTLGLPDVPDLVTAATPVRDGRGVRVRRDTRIGVPADWFEGVGPEVAAARQGFLDRMGALRGVTIVDVTYPADWELLTGAFNAVRLSERTEPFRHWLRKDLTLFGVSSLSWLQGLMLSGDEWITGQRAKTWLLQELYAGLFESCDVVLQTSPVPFDILGLPEIAFPVGEAPAHDGGPVAPTGVILGGQPYEEDRLLEVAAAHQAITEFHLRRPADPTGGARLLSAPALRLDAQQVAATAQ